MNLKHDTITCTSMAVLSVASTTACFVAVLCKGTSKSYLLRLSTLACFRCCGVRGSRIAPLCPAVHWTLRRDTEVTRGGGSTSLNIKMSLACVVGVAGTQRQ